MVLSKFANKSFFTRLISGIVLVALILVTIIPGGNILFFFNMFLSVAALYELYKVLGLENKLPGITGYIALLCVDLHRKRRLCNYITCCIFYLLIGRICIYVS